MLRKTSFNAFILIGFLVLTNHVTAAFLNREYTVDSNTLVLYHLNSGTGVTIIDETGSNNGTLIGTNLPTWVNGHFPKKGFQLLPNHNNTNVGQLQFPSGILNRPNSTVDIYLKWDYCTQGPDTSDSGFLGYIFYDGNNQFVRAYLDDSTSPSPFKCRLQFNVLSYGGWQSIVTPLGGGLSANTWTHVAFTRSWNGYTETFKIYIDGVEQASGTTNGGLLSGGNLYFGAQSTGWGGQIDELRISNFARNTSPAVTGEYFVDSNTIALYHMNAGNGDLVADATGNYNGTRIGTYKPEWISGALPSRGLHFASVYNNPNNGRFQSTTALNRNSSTIEMNLKWDYGTSGPNPSDPGCLGYIFAAGNNQFVRAYVDDTTPARFRCRLEFGVYTTTGWYSIFTTPGLGIDADYWSHVAFTKEWNGTTLVTNIYVNGELQATGSINSAPQTGTTLYFGDQNLGWGGCVDEIRISNYARKYPCNSLTCNSQDELVTLENNKYQIQLSIGTGNSSRAGLMWKRIYNKATSAEYIYSDKRMPVFMVTGDDFLVDSGDFIVGTVTGTAKHIQIPMTYTSLHLSATLNIDCNDSENSEDMNWTLSIGNTDTIPHRIQPIFPVMGRLNIAASPQNTYYFFPWRSGIMGTADCDFSFMCEYGNVAWMQVVSVFNPTNGAGLYTYPKDQNGIFKGIPFKKSYAFGTPTVNPSTHEIQAPREHPNVGEPAQSTKILSSVTEGVTYTYYYPKLEIAPSASYSLPTTMISIYTGGWKKALKDYSTWAHTWYNHVNTPQWFYDIFNTIGAAPSYFYSQTTGKYTVGSSMSDPDPYHLQQWGGWWDAWDPNYSTGGAGDFYYNQARGGLTAFRDEIQTIQHKGTQMSVYIDHRFCDYPTDIGQLHGQQWAVMDPPGVYATYASPDEYWMGCSYEPNAWVDYIADTLGRIAHDTGMKTAYLDELPFMFPCYNINHAHYQEDKFPFSTTRMTQYLTSARNAVTAEIPDGVLMTEHAGSDYFSQFIDGAWSETFFKDAYSFVEQYYDENSLNYFRFCFPEVKLIDWGPSDDWERRCFFNGLGICNFPLTDFLRNSGQTMKENGDSFACKNPEPLIKTKITNVLANKFPLDSKTLYTVYNKNDYVINNTAMMEIVPKTNSHYVELANDTAAIMAYSIADGNDELNFRADANEVLCIAQMPNIMQVTQNSDRVSVTLAPDPNTLALYHMNAGSGTSVIDETGNNNGSLVGTNLPTWIDGIYSKGLHFASVYNNNNNGRLQLTSLLNRNSSTVEMYLKWDYCTQGPNPGDTGCLGYVFVAGNNEFVRAHIDDSTNPFRCRLEFSIYTSSGWSSIITPLGGGVDSTSWTHVAFTRNWNGSNTTLCIYVNGLLQVTGTVSGTPQSGATLYFGDQGLGWGGNVDEVRISNYARKYTVAQYALDEGTGAFAADEYGGGPGALVGTTPPTWVQGHSGNGIQLTSCYNSTTVGQFQLPARILTSPSSTMDMYLNWDYCTQGPNPAEPNGLGYIFYNSDMYLRGYIDYSASPYKCQLDFGVACDADPIFRNIRTPPGSGGFPAGTWSHVALQRSWDGVNHTISIYINGVKQISATVPPPIFSGSILRFGNPGTTGINAWGGKIDDISFRNCDGLSNTGSQNTVITFFDQDWSLYGVSNGIIAPMINGQGSITVPSNYADSKIIVKLFDGDLLKDEYILFKKYPATTPNPSNGATNVALSPTLTWTTGDATILSHDIYFGTNQTNVTNATHASAEFKGNQTNTNYAPGILSGKTSYYWRIDEIGHDGITKGTVWSFTTDFYTEKFQDITVGASGAWTDVDLTSYGVLANQVVEIGLRNSSTSTARLAGVRAKGSAVNRYVTLRAAATTGWDTMVMQVKADANKKIQAYAANTTDVHIILLGTWDKGDYTETFQALTIGTTGSWTDSAALNTYGVSANQIVEVLAANTSTTAYVAGVRGNGSALDRKLTLRTSTSGASECMVMKAKADASTLIEVWKGNTAVTFTLLGYWTTAPGTYTEKFVDIGKPTSSATWYTRSLSSQGVPAYSPCEFLITNAATANADNVGVRAVGSALNRYYNLHRSSASTARSCSMMHVLTDGSSQVQQYLQTQTDTVNFYLLGYWN